MRTPLPLPAFAVAALAGVMFAAGSGGVAEATTADHYIRAAEIRKTTPQCRNRPNAAVKGFVVGHAGSSPQRTFSFVGCFDTMAACERWRRQTSKFIEYRVFQNRCAKRR